MPVGVTVAGQTSNVLDFSYAPPSITAISPATGPTAGGVPVTINSTRFGTSGTVAFAGQVLPAAAVTSWSQTAIVVTEPASEGTSVPVDVTVAGQTSNVLDFSYAPPSITAISPATGPTAGGVPVTIDGTNFGTSGTVTFAGQVLPAAAVTSWSQTAIVVTEPAGKEANVPVGVTVAGQTSNVLDFSYAPPSITAISPATGPTAGGVPVTINGADFRYKWHRHVRRTGFRVLSMTSWSQTAIVVTEPAGKGANVPVGVTVAGQTSNVLDFSYAPPSITAISPATGPTAGGVPVTIDGTNFGTSGTVMFAGQVIKLAVLTSWSQTAIVVTEPAGKEANVPVGVTVAGQTSNVLDFSYALPSITAISPATGPAQAGGVPVTIDGTTSVQVAPSRSPGRHSPPRT